MTMTRHAVLASLCALAFPAAADLAISANDNKVYLDNGVSKTASSPPPDNIAIIEFGNGTAKVVAEVAAPTTVVGPPKAVAINRDESLAFVSGGMKIDDADKMKIVPHNALTVIDLKANPPKAIATLEAGAGAAGVSISPDGTLVLVANRNEGTVSVFKVNGKTVTPAGKLKVGDEKSGPCYAAFTPDGKRALLTRDGDSTLTMLAIDGDKVEVTKRDFAAGFRPYTIGMAPDGSWAVVTNQGRGYGDEDIVSLVDLKANPPRVVDAMAVGQTPEGATVSPDGKTIAVVVIDSSNKAKSFPFYRPHGRLLLLRAEGMKLSKYAEAPIGAWSQGAAFSRDGRTILVQNMFEKDIQVFRLEGDQLSDTGQRVKINGGPAAIGTSW